MRKKNPWRELIDAGYKAYLEGMPCEAPTGRELERGAWVQGWKAAQAEQVPVLDFAYQGPPSAPTITFKMPHGAEAVDIYVGDPPKLWRRVHRDERVPLPDQPLSITHLASVSPAPDFERTYKPSPAMKDLLTRMARAPHAYRLTDVETGVTYTFSVRSGSLVPEPEKK